MAETGMEGKIMTAGLEALKGFAEGIREAYVQKTDAAEYSIKKLPQAEEGYASSYQMTKDGAAVGAVINIPKDQMLKSAEVKTAAENDVPVEGIRAGEKYIDLAVDAADGGSTGQHLYLKASDIMKPASAGSGIEISAENEVSVKIDGGSANGLSAGAGGLALAAATASSSGAMSAADKKKLDEMEFQEITREQAKALITAGISGGGSGTEGTETA